MGYAAFVWPSFGIVLLVMAVLAFASWFGRRRDEAELKQLEQATAVGVGEEGLIP